MSFLASLLTLLDRFDDDAYAALASRGLLRRAHKELEKKPVVLLEETPDSVVVEFAGQRVRFDAGGPANAGCTCPAGGVCQHILAAAIGLQRRERTEEAPAPAAAEPPSEDAVVEVASLHAELLGMPAAVLVKHAGRPGYRWAWQFVQDLDPQQSVTIGGDRNVVITFTQPRLTFRYPGGGIDNLIIDRQISGTNKYRVAAVLAYQRAYGVEPAPPEAPRSRPASLDLGKDHSAPAYSREALRHSQERLRASLRLLLAESVELGLSHLSPGIHQRYSTLAVWAQGVGYHRLALLIRRLADHVEMLIERAGAADEHRLLDELALAFGLVTALQTAAARDVAPAHLVGRARSRYEEAGSLELLGLGSSSWRSASGYVGLTMVLWSPAEEVFYSCTDARPESMWGFDPIARYKAAGPWSGLGAPAEATGKLLTLTGAQINRAGRLSAAESTSVAIRQVPEGTRVAGLLKPFADWLELAQTRAIARRSLLAEPEPMKDWVALQPASLGAARFDTARQTLVLPLIDAANQSLAMELRYSDHTAHAIGRLEQLAAEPLKPGTLFIARVRGFRGNLVAEPLSAIHPAAEQDQQVDALHFDPAPKKGLASRMLARRRPVGSGAERPMPPETTTALPAALGDLRPWLQRQAERGISEEAGHPAAQELNGRLERAASDGLTAFPRTSPGGRTSERMLAVHYICMQYERLIDDTGQQED